MNLGVIYLRGMDKEQSGMYSLNLQDLGRGLVTAVAGGVALAVLAVLGNVFGAGFDAWSVDWVKVFHDVINAAVMGAEGGFVGYLSKNFFTASNGKVFGKI